MCLSIIKQKLIFISNKPRGQGHTHLLQKSKLTCLVLKCSSPNPSICSLPCKKVKWQYWNSKIQAESTICVNTEVQNPWCNGCNTIHVYANLCTLHPQMWSKVHTFIRYLPVTCNREVHERLVRRMETESTAAFHWLTLKKCSTYS